MSLPAKSVQHPVKHRPEGVSRSEGRAKAQRRKSEGWAESFGFGSSGLQALVCRAGESLFGDEVGVLADEVAPLLFFALGGALGLELLADIAEGVGLLQIAGIGHGQGIGSVEILRHVLKAEDALQHHGYLLFSCYTVARDALLDGGRLILGVAEVATQCGADCNTLCLTQFEHRLNILAHKGASMARWSGW